MRAAHLATGSGFPRPGVSDLLQGKTGVWILLQVFPRCQGTGAGTGRSKPVAKGLSQEQNAIISELRSFPPRSAASDPRRFTLGGLLSSAATLRQPRHKLGKL